MALHVQDEVLAHNGKTDQSNISRHFCFVNNKICPFLLVVVVVAFFPLNSTKENKEDEKK